jgi:uncharacterized protein
MVLEGVVSNVAAFGAFVDVGVHQDGLVHVSAMSRDFVADPRAVVKTGEVVRVKVLSVDIPRKRISLTMRLDDEGAGSGGPRAAPGPAREDGPTRPDNRSGRDPAKSGAAGGGGGDRRTGGRPSGGQGSGGRGSGGAGDRDSGDRDSGDRGSAGAGAGAMADALRRAGLTGPGPT